LSNKIENSLSDRQLIARVLNGHSGAFKIIVDNTKGLVAQIIFRMIDNVEERQDLAQEVYLKVYKGLENFKFNSKLSTWIAQITFNTCANHVEKRRSIRSIEIDKFEMYDDVIKTKSSSDHGNETENTIFSRQQAEIVNAEIDRLPPVYRTLIVLYHQEERTYDEIATIVSLPAGTVKSYLFRARKVLKDMILQKYKQDDL
jgi:RNA polymerase sigma factor (sigma-70 family)